MKAIILLSIVIISGSTQAGWLDWLGLGKGAVNLHSDYVKGQDALKREEEYKKKLEQQNEELKQFISLTDRLTSESVQKDRQLADHHKMRIEWEFKSGESLKMKQQSLTYKQEAIKVQKKGNEIGGEMNESIKDGFEKISTPTKLEQASQVATVALATVQVTRAASDFVNWVNPNEETLARKKEASLKLKYMNAEESFNKCFFQNRKSSAKNAEGVPCKCEETFEALLAVIGHVEGKKLKEALKDW